MKRPTQLASLFFVVVLVLAPVRVWAASSTNYKIIEDDIGGGGRVESSSNNYTAQDSLGDAAVGNASGSEYSLQSGPVTTSDPTLTVNVVTSSVNLGALSTSATKTGTAAFSVSNYTSYGYIVQLMGTSPNNGSHVLAGMNTPAGSQTGQEQFGVNLKDNNSPDIGAEAVQVPDSSFSSGAAASGYNSVNNFKYISGDTIAQASQSSGRTDYTISYIANMSINTPGGSYSSNQTVVVTGTY
jgi:hypothetical protein